MDSEWNVVEAEAELMNYIDNLIQIEAG